jgi:hypothetical protein
VLSLLPCHALDFAVKMHYNFFDFGSVLELSTSSVLEPHVVSDRVRCVQRPQGPLLRRGWEPNGSLKGTPKGTHSLRGRRLICYNNDVRLDRPILDILLADPKWSS